MHSNFPAIVTTLHALTFVVCDETSPGFAFDLTTTQDVARKLWLTATFQMLTCIAIMAPSPKAREICITFGWTPKLPTHPVHPTKTRMAVPIASLTAMHSVFQPDASSLIKLLSPVTRQEGENYDCLWEIEGPDRRDGDVIHDRSVCLLSYGLTLAEPARQFL